MRTFKTPIIRKMPVSMPAMTETLIEHEPGSASIRAPRPRPV